MEITQAHLNVRLEGVKHTIREQIMLHADELSDKVSAEVERFIGNYDFDAAVKNAVAEHGDRIMHEIVSGAFDWTLKQECKEFIVGKLKDVWERRRQEPA